MEKITIHISGMHCVSCEILLEREFKKILGVKNCVINHKKGYAIIDAKDDVNMSDVLAAVERCGHKVVEASEKHIKKGVNTLSDYLDIGFAALIIIMIGLFLRKIEVARFFPDFGTQVNFIIAIMLGLVASISSCLAIVGGIVMGFGNLYSVKEDKKHKFLSRMKPHLYFHLGRIGGFFLMGGVLGLIGSKINYSLTFTGYLTIGISIVMLYLGLQILNIVPNITKLGLHLPKSLSHKIHDLQNNDHHLMPILVGALTFFLPCGFTQTMQLAAVTSKDFFTGAGIMAAFALGTTPILLSVGVGSTYAKKANLKMFSKFIGVVVIAFAFYSLNSGLVLSGTSFTLSSLKSADNAISSTMSGSVQIVKMDVDWVFKPTEFKIKKGVPVRWEINGINVSGCSNEVVIPTLDVRQPIKSGFNLIEFTPQKEGVLNFSCWMGMLNGRFIVTDQKGGFSELSEEEVKKELNKPATSGGCPCCSGGLW